MLNGCWCWYWIRFDWNSKHHGANAPSKCTVETLYTRESINFTWKINNRMIQTFDTVWLLTKGKIISSRTESRLNKLRIRVNNIKFKVYNRISCVDLCIETLGYCYELNKKKVRRMFILFNQRKMAGIFCCELKTRFLLIVTGDAWRQ